MLSTADRAKFDLGDPEAQGHFSRGVSRVAPTRSLP